MFLCSPARNPDGSLVRPTVYEINAALCEQLALAAGAVLAVGIVLVIIQWRRPSARRSVGTAAVGVLFMALHPLWTVATDGGDCGELQVLASWAVLVIQAALVGAQVVFLVWRGDGANPDRHDYDDRLG